MSKVIILAAGYSSRLSTNKLLVKIKDETVIARQIRMLRELGISNPVIVIRRDDKEIIPALSNNCTLIYTDNNHKDSFVELKATMPLWDNNVLILLGDLVYSSTALKFMLDHVTGAITVFGLKGNTKWCDKTYLGPLHWGEVFAIKVQHTSIDAVKSALLNLPNKHYDLWNIPYGLNIPITRVDECTDVDFDKDIKPIQRMYGEMK
jgi:hypothetical protein